MYYFLKRVGVNFGVFDTDDGAIDWLSKEELESYVSDGVEIRGVSKDLSTFDGQTVVVCPNLCNWDDGENVFLNAKWWRTDKRGSFSLRVARKTIKGVLYSSRKIFGVVAFNYGVQVLVPMDYFMELYEGEDPIDTVHILHELRKSDDPEIQAFFDALYAGDEDKAMKLGLELQETGKLPS